MTTTGGQVGAGGSVLALDVGGTAMKGAIIDRSGNLRTDLTTRPTPVRDGPDTVVATVLDVLGELKDDPSADDTLAAGLVVPGLVNVSAGMAVWSENLGWHNVPFRKLAEERLNLPVALGHDVRAGGLAEAKLGAARGVANAVFLPIGTGIAVAAFVDGHLLDADGYAGELGHVVVGGDEPCACGGTGCLEAIASAAAIARRYEKRAGQPVPGASEVIARADAGDSVAEAVWEEAVTALADALAIATSLLAPEVIVVGGGLSLAGDRLLKPLDQRLAERLTIQRRPRLVKAELGDRAACLGAGLMAWEKVACGMDAVPMTTTPSREEAF